MSSDIEWTDETWNPVVGCTPVSPGCLNCYAATMAPRLAAMGQSVYVGLTVKKTTVQHGDTPPEIHRHVFNGTVRTLPERLEDPLHWKKPRQVFVNSMSDLFHESVPFGFIMNVFAIMAMCPQHTFQILTKRPERMLEFLQLVEKAAANWAPQTATGVFTPTQELNLRFAQACHGHGPWKPFGEVAWPLPNVWLGTSVEDQPRANERIPWLLKCPAAVRFLSCEPLLGPLDLRKALPIALFHCSECGNEKRSPDCAKCGTQDNDASNAIRGIDWVIVGGESGSNSRKCDIDWVRGIVWQCQQGTTPVFVKQLGAHSVSHGMWKSHKNRKGGNPAEWPHELRVREFPKAVKA